MQLEKITSNFFYFIRLYRSALFNTLCDGHFWLVPVFTCARYPRARVLFTCTYNNVYLGERNKNLSICIQYIFSYVISKKILKLNVISIRLKKIFSNKITVLKIL